MDKCDPNIGESTRDPPGEVNPPGLCTSSPEHHTVPPAFQAVLAFGGRMITAFLSRFGVPVTEREIVPIAQAIAANLSRTFGTLHPDEISGWARTGLTHTIMSYPASQSNVVAYLTAAGECVNLLMSLSEHKPEKTVSWNVASRSKKDDDEKSVVTTSRMAILLNDISIVSHK